MASEPIFPRDRVTIVGVLNLTPDSFSDGGRYVRRGDDGALDLAAAVRAAHALVESGADVIDLGGESTRPGAAEVPAGVEIERTRPVIEALTGRIGVPISIDTRKAEVAAAALAAGARVVNDVSGLGHEPRLADVAAEGGATLVLGHMRGVPETMQRAPHYDDVLREVAAELEAAVEVAHAAGVPDEHLVVDPGLGFGKRLEDNLALLAHAGWLRERLGLPVLLGPSRKSFLGALTGDPVEARELATVAACAVAAFAGADAVRVHDPAGARRAAAVGRAARDARRKELT
ncbi:MAG: dihydropteroate synthase [Proteobacteria bacterium]|nr:dihydropteroate synthase [Pseudomonadota bacterium]